jgi:hypothetical protein
MMVSVVTAEWLEESAPVKLWPPCVAAGMTNMQLNDPTPLVAPEQAVPPLQEIVTVEPAANPVPEKEVTCPFVAVERLLCIWGVIVNVAVAELLDPSLAVNKWPPTAAVGIENEHTKVPAVLVVPEHARPPVQEIVMDEPPENPVELKVNVVPVGPEVWLRASCGVTVKIVVADSPLTSLDEKVWFPAVAAGKK